MKKEEKKLRQPNAKMRKAFVNRLHKDYTFGLYCLDFDGSDGNKWYAPPFLGRDDESARLALVEMSKSHPELQHKFIYCLGSFCAVTGKITSCRPRVVVPLTEIAE